MTTMTTLSVTGMTCEHCVAAVSRELGAVDGVKRVKVTLENGGTSSVVVVSGPPLPEAALREAVDEAGYDVVGVEVREDALASQMTERADQYRAVGTRTTDDDAAPAPAPEEAEKPQKAEGGCTCGCGGHGQQPEGSGLLRIVPLG